MYQSDWNFSGRVFTTAFLKPIFNQFGTALQDVNLSIHLLYVGPYATASARGLSSASLAAKAKYIASKTVRVKKVKKLSAAFTLTKKQKQSLKAGYYKVTIDLKAVKGKAKGTLASPAFFVGAGGKIVKK